MIPPQATEKTEASSGDTDRAGTCAQDVDSQRWLKQLLVGKGLCNSPVVIREE